jgi:hypothetical protein
MSYTLVGPIAPEALKVRLTPGTTGLDMQLVSACSLAVTRPDGSTATWTTTISDKTALQCLATHVFDVAGLEASLPGGYVVVPTIIAAGTPRRCAPFKLHLVPLPKP